MKIGLVVFGILLICPAVFADDVVTNGSFEMLSETPERPRYWYLGWADTPPVYSVNGSWAFDSQYKTDGAQSLRLSPASSGGYQVSQILHVPTHDLSGKTVTVSADIRHGGLTGPATVLVFALNTTLPPDPDLGIGLAGKVLILATGPEDQWQTYTDSFVATDNAICIAVALGTSGLTGSAWFDNIKVELDVPVPGSDPAPRDSVLTNRNFKLGFVGDNPIDYSEKGEEEMVRKAASRAEVFNIFFHVRWNALTGEEVAVGHKERLQQAQRAKAAGLQTIMTFDFTHNDPDGVGDLNPAPDGNPPPGATPFDLTNLAVRNAYKQELLELAAIVRPQYIMVGIEMDIFHDKHPAEWDEYVTMYKDIYNELKALYPFTKVGPYFCLTWMVDNDCTVNAANAADWQMLLPELDYVAYSAYPGTSYYPATALASGYFTAAAAVAPGLPLLLPEFGVTGGSGATLSETEQATYLERIFQELSMVDVEVASWYSLYDQSYIGAPQWFVDEFGKLGMHRQDGTPKEVWAVVQAAYQAPNPFHIYVKKNKGGCNLDVSPLSTTDITGALLPVIFLFSVLFFRRSKTTPV